MTEPTATPLSCTFELRVTDRPDVKNKHGIGYIKPTDVHLRYAPDGIHAQVHGLWRRTDTLSREGELTDKRTDQGYDAPAGDMTGWPDWLTDLAREHAPATPQHVYVVSEIRDSVLRRIHGYHAGLDGAFAYCEAQERTPSTIATARFELFPAPSGNQWMIHSYYGPDDPCPEISDFVIARHEVIPDEAPQDA